VTMQRWKKMLFYSKNSTRISDSVFRSFCYMQVATGIGHHYHPTWSDWVNFHTLGNCLLWTFF
jgi:hypothetical protein